MSLTKRQVGMPAQQSPIPRGQLRKQLADNLVRMNIAKPERTEAEKKRLATKSKW